MKKVLAIMGSQRRRKNSNEALDAVLEGMDKEKYEINKFYLSKLNISPCTGCGHCGRKEECIIKDDMYTLYDRFDDADVVIVSAPLYFNSVNGLTKNMMDRCQRYWSLKYELGKKYRSFANRRGMYISTAGAPSSMDHFIGVQPVLQHFFNSISVKQIGNYFISNTDEAPVNSREDIKEELRQIGENFDTLDRFQIQR